MRNLGKNSAALIALLMLLAVLFPVRAWAHASLVKAIPEPNSRLAEAPNVISLTFDERLDGGLFYIKVFDSNGNSVTKREATMSVDHTKIQLELPKLAQGAYLVSYHVISADGHPVGGSYPLAIGSASLDSTQPPPAAGAEGSEHHHNLSSGFSISDAARLLSRGIYFLTLLAATGWALWQHAARRSGIGDAGEGTEFENIREPEDRNIAWKTWTENTIRAHIVALLLMIATHMQDYIGQGGLHEVELLFTSTSVGLNWIISLVLAILGLWLVGRSFWLDMGWAAALLIVKSMNGHAMTAAAEPFPVIGDFLHLFAAALWVGGMWTLLAKRQIDRFVFGKLLLIFSKLSLISIITLAVTGTLLTILYEPNLRYLLATEWGYVLLGKIVLVIAVVIVAGFLRQRLKRKGPIRGLLLKTDIALMTVIVLLVGVLTYLPTRPQNEPFYWHEMGDKLHVTATISPNIPGIDNNFDVIVWLPIEAGDPKQVRVQLVNQDKKDLAPIDVPVQLTNKSGNDQTFGNFQKFSYHVQGTYLPFAGQWKIVVTVRDKNDDETQADKFFTVY